MGRRFLRRNCYALTFFYDDDYSWCPFNFFFLTEGRDFLGALKSAGEEEEPESEPELEQNDLLRKADKLQVPKKKKKKKEKGRSTSLHVVMSDRRCGVLSRKICKVFAVTLLPLLCTMLYILHFMNTRYSLLRKYVCRVIYLSILVDRREERQRIVAAGIFINNL